MPRLNAADATGRDNEDAADILKEVSGIELLPCIRGRRHCGSFSQCFMHNETILEWYTMVIADKPNSPQTEIDAQGREEEIAAYCIAGAKPEDTPEPKRERKIPILVRFDPQLLKRVDKAARRSGISRSAWIQFMVSRALEREER
jgi:hypothetical protein